MIRPGCLLPAWPMWPARETIGSYGGITVVVDESVADDEIRFEDRGRVVAIARFPDEGPATILAELVADDREGSEVRGVEE